MPAAIRHGKKVSRIDGVTMSGPHGTTSISDISWLRGRNVGAG
jgi:hypothetical protein